MGVMTMDTSRLEALPPEDEMRLIAGGSPSATRKSAYIERLSKNPASAEQIGRALEWMRKSFAAAYPGQTRETRFSNEEWRKAGYDDIAKINELMGRDGS